MRARVSSCTVIFLSVFFMGEAQASCVGLTPEQQVAHASVIFGGRLAEIRNDNPVEVLADELAASLSTDNVMYQWVGRQSVFRVDSVYKGQARRTQWIAQPFKSSIDIDLRTGANYMVFAKRMKEGFLYTDQCNGTREGPIGLDVYGLTNVQDPLPGTDPNDLPGALLRQLTLAGVVSLGLGFVITVALSAKRRLRVRQRHQLSPR